MRPLVLKMAGLRTYRTETSVDFTDLNLLAIVGATGSGKSSLLEAITYALYGNATWEKRNSALIADGALRMTVSLTFEADDQHWQITRSAPHPSKNYPPASQELLCLSDLTQPKIDGSGEVRARIGKLIGLDYEGFKSCVLLPQGRFDQLLKSTAAERVRILKAILGLEALDDTRERAQRLGDVLNARVEEILRARGKFLTDPRAAHDLAQTKIATLTPRSDELVKLENRVQALVGEVRDRRDEEKNAKESASRVAELTDAGLLGRLRDLEQLEADLGRAHSEATVAADAAERDAAAAAASVRSATEQHRSVVAITKMRGTLEATSSALRTITRDRDALEQRRAQVAEDQQQLETVRAHAARFERTLQEQTEGERAAEIAAQDARHAASEAVATIEAIASARDQLAAAEHELQVRQTGHGEAQQHETATKATQRTAKAALDHAQTALDAAKLEEAAAHAAHGCKPGQSCPICAQTLPSTFIAPELSADVATLTAAMTDAHEIERAAFGDFTRARAAVTSAIDQIRSATDVHERASAAWTSFASTSLAAGLEVATVVADEATRALISAHAAQADELLQAARNARAATTGEHQAAAVRASTSEADLSRRQQELEDAAGDFERREQHERKRLQLLPDWAEVSPTAGPDLLDACDARLATALEEAEQREQHAASTASLASTCRQEQYDAKQRIQSEVDGPAVNERNALRALAAEADRHRKRPLAALPGALASIAALISTAEQIVAGAGETLDALQVIASRARAAAEATQQEGIELVTNAGFKTSAELHTAVIELLAELKAATTEQQTAAAQLEPVAELDVLLAQAESLRAGLRELAFQLGDGKFTGYVVARRQQALLALASGIFGQVTAGQYGFTEDFKIVDRLTGSARTPDTLSGGETFLASLALALGLVELAGRSGGRLQALFLDEGFGSLDPDALDQALDELERRADAGRLIAMISHVPAIAERIEQVLQVTKTPQGSHVELLTEEQRAALLLHDVTEQAAAAT